MVESTRYIFHGIIWSSLDLNDPILAAYIAEYDIGFVFTLLWCFDTNYIPVLHTDFAYYTLVDNEDIIVFYKLQENTRV